MLSQIHTDYPFVIILPLEKKVYLYNRKERELKTPVILVYSKNIAKRIKKRPKLFPVVSDYKSDTTGRQEARLLINIYNRKAILDEMNL